MYNKDSYNMSIRPKQTIVVKTVERRSSDGKLLSRSKSKTIYMEEKPISEILPPTKTRYVSAMGEKVLDEERILAGRPIITQVGLQSLEKELNEAKKQLPATIYNYKWEPKRILPCSQILMSNDLDGLSSERNRCIACDSTIYGDDCSSTADTYLKQSKLIRRSDSMKECCRRGHPCASHHPIPVEEWLHKLHESH